MPHPWMMLQATLLLVSCQVQFLNLDYLVSVATGYASQHIWCLSQASINWEGCARKGIQRKNGGDGRDGGTN